MPYAVVKRNGKHCVVKESDKQGKTFGCHGTVKEAYAQIAAIEANEKGISTKVLTVTLREQGYSLSQVASALAWAERFDDAYSALSNIADPYQKANALIMVAYAVYVKGEDETKAKQLFMEAHQLLLGLEDEYDRAYGLSRLVSNLLDAKFLDEALMVANSMSDEMKAKVRSLLLQEKPEVPKSFVQFKQDTEGHWWFLGFYSNKFKDRDGEILSEASHKDYVNWINEKGVQPQVTLFHLPQAKPGFWSKVMWAYEDGKIETKTLNNLMADFYKDYSIAQTERVFYVNGFTAVMAKVHDHRLKVINNLENDDVELGMSHGFVPVEFDGNIYSKYRSFEYSILPVDRAANIYTSGKFMMEVINVDAKDREWVDEKLGSGAAQEIDEQTAEAREDLENKGVEFKSQDLVSQVVESLKLPEAMEAIKQMFADMDQKLDQFNARLEAVEATEDEKIAKEFTPNWKQFLSGPSQSETNVKPEETKVEDWNFFNALGV